MKNKPTIKQIKKILSKASSQDLIRYIANNINNKRNRLCLFVSDELRRRNL